MIGPSAFSTTTVSLGEITINLQTILAVIVILLVAVVVSGILRSMIKRSSKHLHLTNHTQKSAFWIANILLYVFVLVLCLYAVGINVTALLAGLGIVAFAITFAAQDIIANILAGFIIILTKPFRIGDFISFEGDQSGWVDSIELRATNVATYDSSIICVPNSNLLASSVLNATGGEKKVRVAVSFPLASNREIAQLADKLKKIPPKIPGSLVNKQHPVAININPLESIGKLYWKIEILFWIKDSRTQKAAITVLSKEARKILVK